MQAQHAESRHGRDTALQTGLAFGHLVRGRQLAYGIDELAVAQMMLAEGAVIACANVVREILERRESDAAKEDLPARRVTLVSDHHFQAAEKVV